MISTLKEMLLNRTSGITWVQYIVWFTLIILPLIYDAPLSVLGITYSKAFIFNIISALYVVVLIQTLLFRGALYYNTITILFSTLLIYSTIHYFYKFGSFDSKFASYQFSLLIPTLFIAVHGVNKKQFSALLNIIFISLLVLLTYGYFQLFGITVSNHAIFKVTGPFPNPGPYAISISIGFSISFYHMLYLKTNSDNYLYSVLRKYSWVLFAPMLIMLESRAAWVSSLAIIFIIVFIYNKQIIISLIERYPRSMYISILGFIALFVVLGYYIFSYKIASSFGRINIYIVTFDALSENILFGVGPTGFRLRYADFLYKFCSTYPSPGTLPKLNIVEYAFNDLLQLLIEQGLIGSGLFVLILAAVLKSLCIHPSKEAIGGALISFTILLAGLFSYPLQLAPFCFLFTCGMTTTSQYQIKRFVFLKDISRHPVKKMFGTLFIMGLCIHLMSTQLSDLNAHILWLNAENKILKENINSALYDYLEANNTLHANPYFLAYYGSLLKKNGQYRLALQKLEAAELLLADPYLHINIGDCYAKFRQFSLADQHYQRAVFMSPGKLYPQYKLAENCFASGQRDKGFILSRNLLNASYVSSPAAAEIRHKTMQLVYRNTFPEYKNKY